MKKLPGLRWLKVDLGEGDSPLASQYKIEKVPYLMIFDRDGKRIAEGDEAVRWLDETVRRNDD